MNANPLTTVDIPTSTITVQMAFDAVFGPGRWATVSRRAGRLGAFGCGKWIITDYRGPNAAAAILKWAAIALKVPGKGRVSTAVSSACARRTMAAKQAYAEILTICND